MIFIRFSTIEKKIHWVPKSRKNDLALYKVFIFVFIYNFNDVYFYCAGFNYFSSYKFLKLTI